MHIPTASRISITILGVMLSLLILSQSCKAPTEGDIPRQKQLLNKDSTLQSQIVLQMIYDTSQISRQYTNGSIWLPHGSTIVASVPPEIASSINVMQEFDSIRVHAFIDKSLPNRPVSVTLFNTLYSLTVGCATCSNPSTTHQIRPRSNYVWSNYQTLYRQGTTFVAKFQVSGLTLSDSTIEIPSKILQATATPTSSGGLTITWVGGDNATQTTVAVIASTTLFSTSQKFVSKAIDPKQNSVEFTQAELQTLIVNNSKQITVKIACGRSKTVNNGSLAFVGMSRFTISAQIP